MGYKFGSLATHSMFWIPNKPIPIVPNKPQILQIPPQSPLPIAAFNRVYLFFHDPLRISAIFAILVKLAKKQPQAEIAQLVEQRTENPRVRGSSPRLGILQTSRPAVFLSFQSYYRFSRSGLNHLFIRTYWVTFGLIVGLKKISIVWQTLHLLFLAT